MYTDRNFKTKKQLREYFEAGKPVTVYQPGPFGMDAERGVVGQVRTAYLEGPHYTQAHTWYAQGEYEVCSMQMVTLKGTKARWVNGVFVPAPVKQAIVKPENIIEVPPVEREAKRLGWDEGECYYPPKVDSVTADIRKHKTADPEALVEARKDEAIESAEGLTCEGHFGISRDHAKPKGTVAVDVPEGRVLTRGPESLPPLSPEETIDRLVHDALEMGEVVRDLETKANWDDASYWSSRKHGLAMALGYLAGVDPYDIISPQDFEAAGRMARAALRA